MRAVDLVTAGEAFEDLVFLDLPRLPGPGEEVKTSRFLRLPGGGALTTAVAAARLGLRCRVVSGLGPAAEALLRSERVEVANLRRADEPHAITAALSTGGERSFVTFNGVNDRLESRLATAVRGQRARHLHLAFYPKDCGRWRRIVAGARRRGISTSWDFGWNEGLVEDAGFPGLAAELDVLFLNEAEARLYSGLKDPRKAVDHWRKAARNAVVKQGARGSRWVSPELDLHAPAPRVRRVVDTTGAGDAFDGGFLEAFLSGARPAACLKAGNRVGALSTRAPGGVSGLPARKGAR